MAVLIVGVNTLSDRDCTTCEHKELYFGDAPCSNCWGDSDYPLWVPAHHIPTPEEDGVDIVNHPPHYTEHPSGVECITISQHMNFCLGNALKYIWRADLKHDDGGIEDLKKAEWYIKQELIRRGAFDSDS